MTDQELVALLQAAIPRVQVVIRNAEQLHEEAARALDELSRALAQLKAGQPVAMRPPPVSTLELAIRRASKTIAEIAFLSGLSEVRLRELLAGARPSSAERDVLRLCVGDFDGSRGPRTGGTR